ncbi:hypothetical protein A0H81_05279 [Grifola frondosa]|uniref:Uncharacterized protein n=1 Tax=Grifola frondosa TaxID=5627 RepID=A0A1C7MDQ2_GRIFR|nr:hypothetical protein A0H81_05279 [Grifola frondosa]
MSDNSGPNKSTGQYHSMKGTAVETIGNMTGATTWQQSGKEEHAAGEGEYNAAQAQGYVEGTKDRVGGRKDAIVGAVSGDREQETSGNLRRDKGETQQSINNPQFHRSVTVTHVIGHTIAIGSFPSPTLLSRSITTAELLHPLLIAICLPQWQNPVQYLTRLQHQPEHEEEASRGGLGKYLRARGRGRGRGRPAEWGQRMVLEDEETIELEEEAQRELERKFARRALASNVDRYAEPEPELDSEGEEIVEPEVDLSAFLERQRLSPGPSSAPPPPDEDEDIDTSLAHISARPQSSVQSKKGRVQQIEWDPGLEEMSREKAAAEATWDLKARFRAQTARQRGKSATRGVGRGKMQGQQMLTLDFGAWNQTFISQTLCRSSSPPTEQPKQEITEKEGMQDFLDDLLG